jgi:hypothetical protein
VDAGPTVVVTPASVATGADVVSADESSSLPHAAAVKARHVKMAIA